MDLSCVRGLTYGCMKGKYLGAGGNPICTALERVQSLSSCVYPNAAILLRLPLRCTQQLIQCGITYYALYSAVPHHLLDKFKKGVVVSSIINLMWLRSFGYAKSIQTDKAKIRRHLGMTSRKSIGISNSNSTLDICTRYFCGVHSAFLISLYMELAS